MNTSVDTVGILYGEIGRLVSADKPRIVLCSLFEAAAKIRCDDNWLSAFIRTMQLLNTEIASGNCLLDRSGRARRILDARVPSDFETLARAIETSSHGRVRLEPDLRFPRDN